MILIHTLRKLFQRFLFLFFEIAWSFWSTSWFCEKSKEANLNDYDDMDLASSWRSSMAETYPKRERERQKKKEKKRWVYPSLFMLGWSSILQKHSLVLFLFQIKHACSDLRFFFFLVAVVVVVVVLVVLVANLEMGVKRWWGWTRGRRWLWKPFLRDSIDNWKFHAYCNCSFIFCKKIQTLSFLFILCLIFV